MPTCKLQGRVVVVTGASAGVGRAIARALGAQGARVGLVARGTDGLEAAAREIRAEGGEAMVLPADVADAGAVGAVADRVAREWGGIDVWVNNAMVSVFSPVDRMKPEEFRRVTEVTYLGYVYGTLAALEHMRPRDAGLIVQIGSALAYRSIPLQSAYCAAKSAIRGFTDSLRCELAHDRSNIKVTALHLPAVNTPQFQVVRNRLPKHPQPVPPIYQPEVVARAVLYAIEHPRRELWVGWPVIKALLGQKLIPGILDRYLGRKGYEAQQTAKLRHEHRDNLDAPLPGDRGAHGEFDDTARYRSLELWLRMHRSHLAATAALAAIGVVGARAAWRA
jgi:NAD(P)-dependent dehydrogenase (short-subunit alcohol dehydrogenase family)